MDWVEYRRKWKAIFDEYDRKLTRIAVAGLIGGGIRDIPEDIEQLERRFEFLVYYRPLDGSELEGHLAELSEIVNELKEKLTKLIID